MADIVSDAHAEPTQQHGVDTLSGGHRSHQVGDAGSCTPPLHQAGVVPARQTSAMS